MSYLPLVCIHPLDYGIALRIRRIAPEVMESQITDVFRCQGVLEIRGPVLASYDLTVPNRDTLSVLDQEAMGGQRG